MSAAPSSIRRARLPSLLAATAAVVNLGAAGAG